MPKSNLRIDLLGTSFYLIADEDSTYLESILNRYRINLENTRKNTGLTDPLKLAMVTGFLLCDEIQKMTMHRETPESKEAERLTLDLITRIDEALDRRK